MDSELAGALIEALVVIGLCIALWLVLSPPAYLVKLVLASAGALSFPGRAAEIANRVGAFRPALDRFLQRANSAAEMSAGRQSVRIALDERHARLSEGLASTEEGVRSAVANVEGVVASDGPRSVLKEIDGLKDRCKLIDQIAVEMDGDLADQYAARSRTYGTIMFAIPLVLLFASANGALLNLFFRDLIPIRLFGVPVSLILSVMFVLGEIAVGALASWAGHREGGRVWRWFFIAMIAIAAGFEAVVMGLVSAEFEIELAILQDHEALRFWMAPLGVMLASATAGTGYMLHEGLHELADHRGAGRLQRELKEADSFVKELPRTWEIVDQKAQRARASVENYLLALKGKAGDLGGVVNEIRAERERLSELLITARPTDWESLINAGPGDARGVATRSFGLLILSLVTLGGYFGAAGYLFATAFTALPSYASWGLAALVAVAFYVVGLLPFRQLRLTIGESGRSHPMPSGIIEKGVAGFVVLAASIGLMIAAVHVLGGWGVAVGALLAAAGGILAVLGYWMESAMRGLALALTILVAAVACLSTTLVVAAGFVLIWLLAAAAWVVAAVVSIMAKPTELVVQAVRARRTSSSPEQAT